MTDSKEITDKRKDEMPEVWISWKETIKQKNTDNFNVHLWPCVFDHKRDYAVKYIRADLSPPVPDDVAEAVIEVQKFMKGRIWTHPTKVPDAVQTLIRAASTPSANKVTVEHGVMLETIRSLSEEVNALREALDKAIEFILKECNGNESAEIIDIAVKALNQPQTGGK